MKTSMLRYFGAVAVALMVTVAGAKPAEAACASPVGAAGDLMYNTDYSIMQFCDGTYWVGMAGGGASSATINVSATNRLLGRFSAGAGAVEEITVGSGLTLSGGTLSASGSALSGGTNGYLGVWTGATSLGLSSTSAGSQLFWDATNNRLGIGNVTPQVKLHVTGAAGISGVAADTFPTSVASGFPGVLYVTHPASTYGIVIGRAAADAGSGNLALYHTRSADPSIKSALTTGDGIGSITFQAPVDSSNVLLGASIQALVEATPTPGAAGTGILPTNISFSTSGSTTGLIERMRVTSAGSVGIGTIVPQSMLQVSGGIQLADDAATCPGASNVKLGTIKFVSDVLSVCKAAGWSALTTGGAATAAGTNGQVQFNNAGALGADGGLYWDNSAKVLTINNSLTVNSRVTYPVIALSAENVNTYPSVFIFRSSRTNGTTYAQLGDVAGTMRWDNQGGYTGAYISATAAENQSATAYGTNLTFGTAPISTPSGNPIVRMTILNNGNVGINTSTPQAHLHVAKLGTTSVTMFGDASNTAVGGLNGISILNWSDGNNYIDSKTIASGVTYFRTGQGTEAGSARAWLTVTASTGATSFLGNMTAPAYLYSSDRRLKNDIVSLTGSLDKVSGLEPVSFVYKADAQKEKHLGLIAQETQKIFPEVVKTDDKGMLSIDYPGLIGPMIGAIKELKAENDNLKTQNADILKRLEKLEAAASH